MKLYEIDEQLERLLLLPNGDSVDTETGEVFTAEAVNDLQMEREEKIESCLLFVKNQEAEAKALKEEAEKLLARAKTCTNNAVRCKDYVQHALEGAKFKTSKVAVSYRLTKSVEVTCNLETLPVEYKNIKVDIKPNKVALKKALEAGETFEGVELVESQSMQIK